MDAQTIRIHELETDERNRAEALRKQLQEANRRLVRVVQEVRGRTKGMLVECVTLVDQILVVLSRIVRVVLVLRPLYFV